MKKIRKMKMRMKKSLFFKEEEIGQKLKLVKVEV
jgi:hypothetical protein